MLKLQAKHVLLTAKGGDRRYNAMRFCYNYRPRCALRVA
jgi:hypothetical protein